MCCLETRGNHFWGSSTYSTHQTARKSALDYENHATVDAAVQGITLATLPSQSVSTTATESTTTSTDSTAATSSNNFNVNHHLLLKIDIEGAEFVLLDEAWQSGILCQYCTAYELMS